MPRTALPGSGRKLSAGALRMGDRTQPPYGLPSLQAIEESTILLFQLTYSLADDQHGRPITIQHPHHAT